MATKFLMGRDINGYPCFSLPFTDTKAGGTLAQNVAQSFTVPEGFNRVAIIPEVGATVFAALNETATVWGSTIVSVTSEMNPGVRDVAAGDVISLITPNVSAYVGLQFYVV